MGHVFLFLLFSLEFIHKRAMPPFTVSQYHKCLQMKTFTTPSDQNFCGAPSTRVGLNCSLYSWHHLEYARSQQPPVRGQTEGISLDSYKSWTPGYTVQLFPFREVRSWSSYLLALCWAVKRSCGKFPHTCWNFHFVYICIEGSSMCSSLITSSNG